MENYISGKVLHSRLELYEKDSFRLLKRLTFMICATTVLLNPTSATIFLMEYFKIDPMLALTIIMYSFPLITATIIARTCCTLWIIGGRYLVVMVFIIPLLPFIYIGKLRNLTFMKKLEAWINKKDKEANERHLKTKETGVEREIKIIHYSIFIIATLSLGVSMFFDNPIANLWNPAFNKALFATTNAHYYCQITGNYNEEQCKEWKAELAKYKHTK